MSINQLKKRLEIIKTLLELEDYETILPLFKKCASNLTPIETRNLVLLFRERKYATVIEEIDKILNKSFEWENTTLSRLEVEVQKLRQSMNETLSEKLYVESRLVEFRKRYHREVGEDLLKIAYYEQMTQTNKPFEAYTKQSILKKKALSKPLDIKDKEGFETLLKKQFRKATKLCHPDSPTKAKLKNVDNYFLKLQTYFKDKNLYQINELIQTLEPYQITQISHKESIAAFKMEAELKALIEEKKSISEELNFLRTSKEYLHIKKAGSIEKYFEQLKSEHSERLQEFEKKFS